MEELLLTQPEFRRYKAMTVIIEAVTKFIRKVKYQKLRQRSALKIQTAWRKL